MASFPASVANIPQPSPGTLLSQSPYQHAENHVAIIGEIAAIESWLLNNVVASVGTINNTVLAASVTAYTLQAADIGTIIFFTSSSGASVTVPSGVFARGEIAQVVQYGAGALTLKPSGTVLNSFNASLQTAGEYAVVNIYCQSAITNTFLISGMLL